MATIDECKEIWKSADTVCFDVDSTLLKDEGLDELAEFCGVGQEVKEWTRKAMGGSMRFQEALERRLDIVKPTHGQVAEFTQKHKVSFSDGVQDLIALLQKLGTNVYLVSGGFRTLIEPAAKILQIPPNNIFANRLKFYHNGEYAGFDTTQPTSDSGGKTKVAALLKQSSERLVFIGDGTTDLEASPPADCFIGYGGNVVRAPVKEKSVWFITDFGELTQLLGEKNS